MKYLKIFYFIIPFLILTLIFGFGLACGDGSEPKEEAKKEEKSLAIETISKTIDVKYMVVGIITDEISVTYSNYQGGTEQNNNLKLKSNLEEVYKDTNLNVDDIPNYDENREKYKGSIIYHYEKFPKDEFLYISAQNQKNYGIILVNIIVDNEVWKFSKAEGEYCIATADGYYD